MLHNSLEFAYKRGIEAFNQKFLPGLCAKRHAQCAFPLAAGGSVIIIPKPQSPYLRIIYFKKPKKNGGKGNEDQK
jgi:hypothetical protein